TGVQTCALPICPSLGHPPGEAGGQGRDLELSGGWEVGGRSAAGARRRAGHGPSWVRRRGILRRTARGLARSGEPQGPLGKAAPGSPSAPTVTSRSVGSGMVNAGRVPKAIGETIIVTSP